MADDNTTRESGKDSDAGAKKDKDILKQARRHWDAAMDRERENQKQAKADLEFLAGDNLSQWPEKQRKDRETADRPVLQINRLPQFVHQITGDIRQMKPALKFVPVDNGADEKRADLVGNLVRYIENRSDASAIYFRAADSQVACGIGHWRVITEYADGTTFNQEIRIAPIEDGVSVLWDPDSILPSKEDAGYCFVPVDMSRDGFKERFPEATPEAFADETWTSNVEWVKDDYIRVAEYWCKKPTKRKLLLGPDGSVQDLTDLKPEEQAQAIFMASMLSQRMGVPHRVEERESHKICRYLITASEVLETEEWIGNLIPIVPVVGEETRIGRKILRNGVVRHAIDPQRMVNYFHSAHTEVVALQPKAPYMVTAANIAKYQDMWEQANRTNLPYLVFDPDKLNGGQAPQRIPPPVSSQGVIEGLQIAQEDMKAVIGIYDASLGAKSNETSGKAILARQREGDVGSYLYIDNFARAVRRTGQILADLIPKIYDNERTIRIVGEDGKIDIMEINKAQGVGPQASVLNDLTIGSYDVVATVGPSYTTKREEARENMVEFFRAFPQLAMVSMDLVAKSQDWPLADEIAKRARAMIPPQILMREELEKQGLEPEQIDQVIAQNQPEGPPPDPDKVAKAEAIGRDADRKDAAAQVDIQHKQRMGDIEAAKAATDAGDRQRASEHSARMAAYDAQSAEMKDLLAQLSVAIKAMQLTQMAEKGAERAEAD